MAYAIMVPSDFAATIFEVLLNQVSRGFTIVHLALLNEFHDEAANLKF
jgi:hypothetical protein